MAFNLLDVVAPLTDLPERRLRRGQVGRVVEALREPTDSDTGMYEVEFSDERGVAYAQCALDGSQLMVLHYETTR